MDESARKLQPWANGMRIRARGEFEPQDRTPRLSSARREQVPELLLLGLQIIFCVGAGINLAGYTFDHLDTSLLERGHLVGIIGQQAHLADAQRLQHFSRKREIAVVRLEAQALIGFHGIESGILQFVGLQLRHQADAAPFLLLVNQHAGALFGDHRKRHLELLPAIAAQRREDVAGEALGMNADQRRGREHVSHHQGDGLLFRAITAISEGGFEAIDPEPSPAGRKISRGELSNGARRGHTNIIDGGMIDSRLSGKGMAFAKSAACVRRLPAWEAECWSIPGTLLKLNGTPTSGAVAQLGERLVRNEEATGSIPVSSTKSPKISSRVPLLLRRDLG